MGSIDCVLERDTAPWKLKKLERNRVNYIFQTTFTNQSETGSLSPGNNSNLETYRQGRPRDKF